MPDTIFAQATAPGRAGVAVIRISGPDALAAATRLTKGPLPPRRATLRDLREPGTGDLLDEALLLFFPAPASFTGEAVVELQCHGSPAVCRRLLQVLADMDGLRIAMPGEFTRRALENGRLDLAQVEGLGDLLQAETEAQRRQALSVASGALSNTVERWRTDLLEALALVEAVIDFGEDVPDSVLAVLPERLGKVADAMSAMLDGSMAAERIREGFTVALCGEPNVGKSTLLNAIAGREVALTSELAGTTRDVIEVQLELRGLPVTLLDTAGLREAEDRIERLGVERARKRMDAADLRIFLSEHAAGVFEKHVQKDDILVGAKADLGPRDSFAVSGLTGEGLDELLDRIAAVLEERAAGSSGLGQERQRRAAGEAREFLHRCLVGLGHEGGELELIAFDLRGAVRALETLTGRVDVEAVLDVIFRRFCLGK